jgi:hypothetical protein
MLLYNFNKTNKEFFMVPDAITTQTTTPTITPTQVNTENKFFSETAKCWSRIWIKEKGTSSVRHVIMAIVNFVALPFAFLKDIFCKSLGGIRNCFSKSTPAKDAKQPDADAVNDLTKTGDKGPQDKDTDANNINDIDDIDTRDSLDTDSTKPTLNAEQRASARRAAILKRINFESTIPSSTQPIILNPNGG